MEQQGDFLTRQTSRVYETRLPGGVLKEFPDPAFFEPFSRRVEEIIRQCSSKIPPSLPPITVQREGRIGVLPSPAKTIIAKEMLSGSPPSPLKIYEETIPSQEPERLVKSVTFHAIVDIGPSSLVSAEEISSTLETMLSLKKIIGQKGIFLKAEVGQPAIRVGEFKALIHLLTRSAVGNYRLKQLPLDNYVDLKSIIFALREAYAEVLKPTLPSLPSTDFASRQILSADIVRAIEQGEGDDTLSIPILVCPKNYYSRLYETTTYTHGDEFLPKDHPFINVQDLKTKPTQANEDAEGEWV